MRRFSVFTALNVMLMVALTLAIVREVYELLGPMGPLVLLYPFVLFFLIQVIRSCHCASEPANE